MCVTDLFAGVGDTNLARSNISADVLKHCAYIWIVAPIQRAVDDHYAKSREYQLLLRPKTDMRCCFSALLGEAFKDQLMSTSVCPYSRSTYVGTNQFTCFAL